MRTFFPIFVSRVVQWSALMLVGGPLAYAQTPVCTDAIKKEAATEISASQSLPDDRRMEEEARIYEKYRFCAEDAKLTPPSDTFFVAARRCGATVSSYGSLYFEEMSCCGYDPQRRMFTCPITIKQRVGYGAAPLPGSRELVLSCVANAAGVFVPVALDSVHLADEMFGQLPPWQFTVIAAADQNVQLVQPMSGATLRARSILSWGLQPTNCNFTPIWGNVLNYRIRLDQ